VGLPEGEERVVKAGHVLAWTEATRVKFGKEGGGREGESAGFPSFPSH